MARAAVLALALVELRRSWRTLLVLGVLAGLAAGAALGAATMAVRTTTAHDRLLAATALDDARVLLLGRPDLAGAVAALPGVRSAWPATATVGRLAGEQVHYVSVTSGPPKPPDLFTPVVVRGRAPGDDAAREVVVSEPLADLLRLGPGSSLPLALLTPAEVRDFDVGFGEPDGPTVQLQVTGVVRVTTAGNAGTGPVYGGPAFAREFAPWIAGVTQLLRLEPGEDARRAFETGLAELAARSSPVEDAAEFGPVEALYPTERTDPQVALAEGIVGAGLWAMVALAALTGALVTWQGLGRLAAAGGPAQRTESALGLVTLERVAARVLPAGVTAGVAAALAAGGALLGGLPEPVGRLSRYEPEPGWAPNLLVALGGAALTALAVVGVAALTAWSAGRPPAAAGVPEPRALARGLRSPALLVGAHLALATRAGRAAGHVPARTTLLGAVLALTGVVSAGTTAAGLAAFRDDAAGYGWSAHFSVVDAQPQALNRLVADPAVADVDLVRETTVRLAGQSAVAYATEPRKGALPWSVVAGRLPATPDEVALGPKLADRLGLIVGDTVPLGPAERPATVVGLVTTPPLGGESLGTGVLLSTAALAGTAESQPLQTALVRAVGDPGPVYDRYAADLELMPAEAPVEIANLDDFARLPQIVQVFLIVMAAAAIGHTLLLTARRRALDMAVLRTLGCTPRQAGSALVTMAVTTVLVALAVGVPLGAAISRLVWEESPEVGPFTDLTAPTGLLLVLVPGALLGAALVAAVPARRAARLSPAAVLRGE